MRQTAPTSAAVLSVEQPTNSAASSLIERAPFGICRSSYSGDRFLSVNPALCRMLGYSEQELLQVSISQQIYATAANRFEIGDLLRRDQRLNAQETYL